MRIDPVSYLQIIQSDLEKWRSQSLQRSLKYEPGLIDFSSNDYLSLNRDGSHRQLLEGLISSRGQNREQESPHNNGVGSTGSRLIRGHDPAFDRAEEQARIWFDAPSALLFQSGYAANIGAISALTGPGDVAFCDRLCHASLLDGVRLSGANKQYFNHNDLDHLETLLKTKPARRGRWVLSESVFSMDGDTPDIHAMLALCKQYDATLFLDEAHALGYYGSDEQPGAGLIASMRNEIASPDLFEHLILSAPLGKAPGLMGGFMLGHESLKQYLINRARSFVFSTAQPPLLADMIALVLEGFRQGRYNDRIAQLRSNATWLRDGIQKMGWPVLSESAIIPVVVGDAERAIALSDQFRGKEMDVRPIRPPTVAPGSSRIRLTVQSAHTAEQLQSVLDVLSE